MTELKAGLAESLPPPEWLSARGGPAAGMRLAFRAYPAAGGRPRAHVLISHGFSEHAGWWQHVALALQARGLSVYLFDHYHHGASAGRTADVPHFDVLGAGLRLALEEGVLPRAGQAPVILLGHSNGGLAALWALPEIAASLRGLVLCSPLIQMRWIPKWLGFWPAWIMSRTHPGVYWPIPRRPPHLTSAAQVWADYGRDRLRFHKVSPRFFLAMRAASNAMAERTDLRGLPLLLLCADADRIVDVTAMLRWYGRAASPAKTLLRHPGKQHELFNETDWEQVVGEVVSWLESAVLTRSERADPPRSAAR